MWTAHVEFELLCLRAEVKVRTLVVTRASCALCNCLISHILPVSKSDTIGRLRFGCFSPNMAPLRRHNTQCWYHEYDEYCIRFTFLFKVCGGAL